MKRMLCAFLALLLVMPLGVTSLAEGIADMPLITLFGGKIREENTDGTGDCIKSGPVPFSFGTFIKQTPLRIGEVPAKNVYDYFFERFPGDVQAEDFVFRKAFLAKAEEFAPADTQQVEAFYQSLKAVDNPFEDVASYTLNEGDITWHVRILFDGVQRYKVLILRQAPSGSSLLTADALYAQ